MCWIPVGMFSSLYSSGWWCVEEECDVITRGPISTMADCPFAHEVHQLRASSAFAVMAADLLYRETYATHVHALREMQTTEKEGRKRYHAILIIGLPDERAPAIRQQC